MTTSTATEQEQVATCLSDAQEALSAGRLAAAHGSMMKASRLLLMMANASSGQVRSTRAEMARRVMVQAQEIEERMRRDAERAAALAPPSLPTGPAARVPQLTTREGDEGAQFLPVERPSVRLSEVAGLEPAKEQIRLRMVYPFTHPEAAARFGVARGGGVLLYGPPGTGKTLLARAVAGELDAPFYSVKPSEVMSQWVGVAEQNIERLFRAARSHPRAVIFIDEVEALVPKRRSSGSTVMQRLVPQILAELEGFEKKEGALLFIGATNEPWSLDPAVLRPGRFDEKILVPLPDLPARLRILELNLRDRPLAPDVDLKEIAGWLGGHSGADVANLCRKACTIPFVEAVELGIERDVSVGDFRRAAAQVRPSVTEKEAARYDKYQQTGE